MILRWLLLEASAVAGVGMVCDDECVKIISGIWCFMLRLIPATKQDMREMEKRLMATQAEALEQVKALTETINKVSGETAATLQKVTELQAIIDAGNGGDISDELQTAINEAVAAAKKADDLVPDAPVG
jgi:hypothetical protein